MITEKKTQYVQVNRFRICSIKTAPTVLPVCLLCYTVYIYILLCCPQASPLSLQPSYRNCSHPLVHSTYILQHSLQIYLLSPRLLWESILSFGKECSSASDSYHESRL